MTAVAAAPHPRHTNWQALLAGLVAYALVKLAAIGLVTGVGPAQVAAMPELFVPAATTRVLSELFGAGLILTFLVGFTKISPRSGFLSTALVQAAIGWLAPMEWKDGWMRWLFSATGLDQVWAQAGLSPPFQPHAMFGGLSAQDLITCAVAGAVAQTVHNLVAGQPAREPRRA